MLDGYKYTLWALKQYNLLYGDVLTNARIEEGVERELTFIMDSHIFLWGCPFKQTNKYRTSYRISNIHCGLKAVQSIVWQRFNQCPNWGRSRERLNVHYGPLFRGQTIVRQAVQVNQASLPRQTILDWPAYRTVGHLFPYVEKGRASIECSSPSSKMITEKRVTFIDKINNIRIHAKYCQMASGSARWRCDQKFLGDI